VERFPQYLSSPVQVLWFESDELAMLFLCLILAMIFGGVFWLLMAAGPFVYSRLKKNYPRGFFKHLTYFIGIKELSPYPGPFQNFFVE